MPIIVDPQGPRNELPTTATSQDGRLSAEVDAQHAGMLLQYDGSADVPAPTKVRFTRTVGNEGVSVRSGDLAYAPGGYAIAYDQEVGLDVAAAYTATPQFSDGSTGTPSQLSIRSAAAKGRGGQLGMWLKDLESPDNSLEPLVTSSSELGFGTRSSMTTVLGSSYPVSVSRSTVAPTFTVTLLTENWEEYQRVSRLLSLPGFVPDGEPPSVLLVQYMPAYQRLDQFAITTSVNAVAPETPAAPTRRFEIELSAVGRPDATNAPLRIPGRSYESVARIYTAYSDIPQSNASYVQLAIG